MAKAVNYTPEMLEQIKTALAGDVDHKAVVMELAERFERKIASVRAVAVRNGWYKKAEYLNKNGEKPESKADIVERIAKELDVPSEAFDSLAKANKAVLVKIAERICGEDSAEDSAE